MRLFKKKDKRYNTQLDNYSDKYADTFKLGLIYVVIGLFGYGIYKIYTLF
jgi:hypothetical protein